MQSNIFACNLVIFEWNSIWIQIKNLGSIQLFQILELGLLHDLKFNSIKFQFRNLKFI